MKKSNISLLMLIIAALFLTCSKGDETITNPDSGTNNSSNNSTNTQDEYYKIERIKDLFPNMENVERVVFKNAEGLEKGFSIEYTLENKDQTAGTGTKAHKTESHRVNYNLEDSETVDYYMAIKMYSIKSTESDLIVEVLSGSLYNSINNGTIPIFELIDADLPIVFQNYIYEESVTLLDKNFSDVYTNLDLPITLDGFDKIHYNPEFGLIGFHDAQGDLWVYEHSE